MKNIISKVNEEIKNNTVDFIKKTEEDYRNRIIAAARLVTKDPNKRIILLAGPSASGKTTSAHILRDHLLDYGINTEMVSLDDFYKTHDKMPRDEFGKLDFESVHSLQTDDIKKCMTEIIKDRKTDLPVFNFETRQREDKPRHIEIDDNGVVIVEGLHALNPLIANELPQKNILKLYITVGMGYYNDSNEEILCSREIRLMRRLSRDMIYRNSSPQRSLEIWSSVVRGEEKYLCPYTDAAEMKLVSFHDYEICIFKTLMLDTLKTLPKTVENYENVQHIISAMELACPLKFDYIPEDSLLKEFMRGGKYE